MPNSRKHSLREHTVCMPAAVLLECTLELLMRMCSLLAEISLCRTLCKPCILEEFLFSVLAVTHSFLCASPSQASNSHITLNACTSHTFPRMSFLKGCSNFSLQHHEGDNSGSEKVCIAELPIIHPFMTKQNQNYVNADFAFMLHHVKKAFKKAFLFSFKYLLLLG